MRPGDRILALVPGRICAEFAGEIEDIVRREFRRNGCPALPDRLAVMLAELADAGATYAALVDSTTAVGTAEGGQHDCRESTLEYMTTSEVAERLGCRPRNVVDLIGRGRLDAVRSPDGHAHLVDPDSVTRYEQDRGGHTA